LRDYRRNDEALTQIQTFRERQFQASGRDAVRLSSPISWTAGEITRASRMIHGTDKRVDLTGSWFDIRISFVVAVQQQQQPASRSRGIVCLQQISPDVKHFNPLHIIETMHSRQLAGYE